MALKTIRNPMKDKGPWLWYLVQTAPGSQRKTVRKVRKAGFRAVMIVARRQFQHKRTKKPIVKTGPAFGNYIFVRMPRKDPNWFKLKDCDGVESVMSSYVSEGGGDSSNLASTGAWVPFPVPRKVVADLIMQQRRGLFDDTEEGAIRRGEIKKGKHARLRATFAKGSSVRVTDGPFASFPGLVEAINTRGMLMIEVSIFGRPTLTELDPDQVELVSVGAGE